MQEVQTQPEAKGKCCGKNGGNRAQHGGKCKSSHKREGNSAATASPLEILHLRFARGEIDTAEFEEKRRLIATA